MAHLMEDQAIRRSYSNPLFINESNDDRTTRDGKLVGTVTPPRKVGDNSDSTCIRPISNSCSSSASQRSSLSITPPKLYTTTYLTPRSSSTSNSFGDSTAAEFFSFASDELNETVTNSTANSVYETCIEASVRLLAATRSVKQRLQRPLKVASSELLNKLPKLQRLSVVRASQINIHGDSASKSRHCTCEDGRFDGNCLKSFMEMSVQPAEYRNNSQMMTSTPLITKDVYDHGIFNVARIKKVELHDLSPKVSEFHVIDATPKDRCINNNNIRMLNGNHFGNQTNVLVSNVVSTTPIRTKGQHQSNPNSTTMPVPEDGNVLKKVISFTLDQINNVECTTEKAARPSFVPQKLHFSAYEQFKGSLFVKWVSSSMTKVPELSEISLNTLEVLISEVCTHLMAAGVMKQIADCDEKIRDVFCPNQMYQWTHIKQSRQQQNGPKKDFLQSSKQCSEQETKKYQNGTTDTLISSGHEESFASIKTRLLSRELTLESVGGNDDQQKTAESINSDAIENQMEHVEGIQSNEIDEAKEHHCDINIKTVCVEASTQTDDDIAETNCNEQKLPKESSIPSVVASPSAPIPPPPPPAPLFAFNATSSGNKSIVSQPINQSTTQNTSSTTILSSASSFCPPPPPPLMPPGPPPLPLPLPTSNMWFKSDTLRKAAKHPPKPMINLFWTRILMPVDDEETKEKQKKESDTLTTKKREKLWQKIDETVLENADDFTELFARQATPKRPREVNRVTKKSVVKVLDHKRSQSVGIFSQSLYRHRIDSQVIQRAIYNWDLSNIGLDLLQSLLEHRATHDELKAIKEALKNTTASIPLDGPENFLLKFSEISCAPERIACIIYRNDFEEAIAQIEQKIKTIQNLCEFLVENDHLNDLFAIILTLGNFMNGGNRYRGQADGFGLDVLNKLKDVKSKDKKITLLHFIVRTFISKRRQNGLKPKEIIYPLPDADSVKSASTVDFDMLNEQIVQLCNNLKDIEQKMKIVIDSATDDNIQPFKDISEEFVQIATNKIDYQFQQLKTCKILFRETLDYFKHIPKTGTIDDCTPSQFFELWESFCADFRDLWKKELTAINAEIIQKYKSIASPKTPQNRGKGKQKPGGLRMRRVNQI